MTAVYLVRHGRTDYNVRHQLQGQRDTLLNSEGIAQAEQAAAWLRARGIVFDRIFTSPLERAVRTAEIMTGKDRSTFLLEERLKEIDFGPLEGIVYEELDPTSRRYLEDPWGYPPVPGMEPVEAMFRRAESFLEELAGKEAAAGGTVLIATHGMMLRALLYALLQGDPIAWTMPIPNVGIYRSFLDGKGYGRPELLTEARPTFE
jgi:broad specificity phosphatase PhoE